MVSRSLLLSVAVFSTLGLGAADAATVLLDIPLTKDGAESAGPGVANAALGTEFHTSDAVSDIEISFVLNCFNSCAGELVLVADRPGPSVPFNAFQKREFFDFAGSGQNTISAFSGFNLLADTTYALVVAITGGGAIWFQTDPSKSSENGISDGQDFFTTVLNQQAIYRSDFTFEPLDAANFNLKITGEIADGPQTPTPVPLPAAGWMLGAAVLAAGWGGSHRRNANSQH